jgi:hypothetical protein
MLSKTLKKIVLFAATLALTSSVVLATSLPQADAQTRGWADGETTSRPSTSDLIPSLNGDEAYTERYSFAVDLDDDGGHIGVDFTISNLGWGKGHGASEVRVRLPEHKNYSKKKKVKKKDWSYSESDFDVDIGNTRVKAKGDDSFEVTHEGGDVSFRLVFENTTSMWKPGTGRIAVDEGFYKFNLLAPRANVTGEVTIGGETHEVKATRRGYADHVATNVAPFNFAKRFSRFRNYNDDVFVMWREIELHPDHGGDSYTWVVVGYKDKIVFSDPKAKIRFANMRSDPKAGYEFPMAIQIDGKNGDDSIKLVLRGTKFKRKDLLKHYGSAARMVASAVSNPFRYTVNCKYTLQMKIGGAKANVKGRSHFVLDYVNK